MAGIGTFILLLFWLLIIVGIVNMHDEQKRTDEELDLIMGKPTMTDSSGSVENNLKPVNPVPTMMVNLPGTRDLVFQTLRSLGCEFTGEDDTSIRFTYQSGNFAIETVNDYPFINLHFPWMYDVSADDIEEFARIRKVINQMNFQFHCTFFYTVNHNYGTVGVHAKRTALFSADIHQYERYLQSMIEYFFHVQRIFYLEMDKLKSKEKETLNG